MTSSAQPALAPSRTLWVFLPGGLALLVGTVALAGWIWDVAALRSIHPDSVSMKSNTAIAFILLGGAALIPWEQRRRQSPGSARVWLVLGCIASGTAAALAVLTLSQDLFGWDLGIDQWLFAEAVGQVGTSSPGRMAPETAVCFTLLSLAMWVNAPGRPRPWLSVASVIASAVVTTLTVATLLCYLTPSLGQFGWGGLTIMAVPTAATLGVVGLATSVRAARQGELQWTLSRGATAAFVCGLALLLLSGLNLSRSHFRMREASVRLAQREQVLGGFSAIMAEIARAQNHTRGYALTGDDRFARSFDAAAAGVESAVVAQRQRIGREHRELQQLERLEPHAREALAWFQTVIFTRRNEGPGGISQHTIAHGEDLMDRLRTEVENFVAAERRLLDLAHAEANAIAPLAFAVILSTTAVSVAIFLIVLFGLNRAEGRRQAAEEALRESHALLERRVMERTAALTRSQQFLDAASRIARVGYWELELGRNELQWSDMVREIHEVGADFQPTLVTGIQFYAPEAVPVITAAVQAAIANGRSFDVELQLITAKGNRPWVRSLGEAVYEGGRIVKVRGAFQDITVRRRADDELIRQRDELKAANQELEAFSYSVSHDLRAPLRSIDGFSRIALQQHGAQFTAEAREALEVVRASSQQMGRLIDDLLIFARLNRQALRKSSVDVGEMVGHCLATLRPELEGRRVEITTAELPACAADPGLLTLVWTNLLSNALKYSRRRDPARIEIGCQRNGIATYFVRDNGVGFKMAYADKLFGVFQRLHRAEDYEGTGVGLATAQRIITRHGGRIWADSVLNEGATFFFTLEPSPTP